MLMLSKEMLWASKINFRRLPKMITWADLSRSQSATSVARTNTAAPNNILLYLNKLAVVHAHSQAPSRDLLNHKRRNLPTPKSSYSTMDFSQFNAAEQVFNTSLQRIRRRVFTTVSFPGAYDKDHREEAGTHFHPILSRGQCLNCVATLFQMQDFMKLYSGLVERCFNTCCNDFTSKALSSKEVCTVWRLFRPLA